MMVLFMCLSVAVVVQTVTAVVVCVERALVDESLGRKRMAEKELGLQSLRLRSASGWVETPWAIVCEGPPAVEGRVTGNGAPRGWVMGATVRHGAPVSALTLSAVVERGQDGLDLPIAALVAGAVCVASERTTAWLRVDVEPTAMAQSGESGPSGDVAAHVCEPPGGPQLGPGCSVLPFETPWRLDPGWRAFAESGIGEGLAPSRGATLMVGGLGATKRFPKVTGGRSVADPVLVVLVGGAALDARYLGELYGVLVVDEGSVMLDGTRLHGAVFSTGAVDLGATGQVVFSKPVLRWATDRSLVRTRLVPGSRREGTD